MISIGQAQIKAAQTALRHLQAPESTITTRRLTLLAECSEESARKALKKLVSKGILSSRVTHATGNEIVYFRRSNSANV